VTGWLAMMAMAIFCGPNLVYAQHGEAVASWDFGSEESTPLETHGAIHRDQPGPRPPEFPDFDSQNTAVVFDGKGSHFEFGDPGVESRFDFTNGDEITLEAWVKVSDLRSGENLYIIGKGRTGDPDFARDNQNWALRVRESSGQARASFLFATPRSKDADEREGHWHRWTTSKGFAAASGWHHIAVAYRFGQPDSIRGWIDGVSVSGKWDMGGETTKAPVVDDDAIWIGSSQGGSAGNSFRGSLDSIAIYRKILDDATMAKRYRQDEAAAKLAKTVPAVMPELGKLPAGMVLTTFHEGMPSHDRWLQRDESWPNESDRWVSDAFLLPRLPLKYDDWGIRDKWKAPVLVRMAADIPIEPGVRQFLLRARGLSRLWVDGELVAQTQPCKGSPSGEEPITPIPEPPMPGLRLPSYRQQEVIGSAKIEGAGKCRVVLECLVGGAKFRPEPGELCVAVSSRDNRSFVLLQPFDIDTPPKDLTDATVEPMLRVIESQFHEKDDAQRRLAAASQNAFWENRHAVARSVVGEHHDASQTIDGFIETKIVQAKLESSKTDPEEAKLFNESVLPILRSNCFRCHGEKDNGGLKLNSPAAALKGGDSESPAFVPGDVNASEAISRIRSDDEDTRMPPTGDPLSEEEIKMLEAWVEGGAVYAGPQIRDEDVAYSESVDDAGFLRRVTLDTIGLPPSEQALRDFLADDSADKRSRVIEQLLHDERWADHWVSYWQDVLAENPSLINASLNSTGPFRWFLWEALRDNKPMDRWVSELILMRGGKSEGGSAGFGLAGDNDAPLASKGQILASAFLGVELQCARCHDSPYHSTKQKDLYSLAAMLDRKPITVPKTSMVPAAFFEKKERESLIKATLKPNEPVKAEWSFADVCDADDDASIDALMQDPQDSRERLAALITGPQNSRFPRVVVNRIWRRLIGAGIVEPPQDWEGKTPSHPEMLDWLADELVMHGYDFKHVIRLILNSKAYQREADGYNLAAEPEVRFFNAPDRRRMSGEQIVDSLYAASDASIDVEELTFDPDGRREASNRLTLGMVRRAWMFASLNNERDRPSLTLPKAQAIDDVLTAFGWSGARQMPRTDRETSSNVLQPGVLANGTLSTWLTSASYQSGLATLALEAESPAALLDSLFLRFLGRHPIAAEQVAFLEILANRFENRIVPADQVELPKPLPVLPRVTWSNHLVPEATTIQNENERRARNGQPPDPRLDPQWRDHYEDIVWSLINHREFVWIP
jgi:cytochrome c553